MTPTLPPELLDLVLEEFHPTDYLDERRAIAHCGLVCKSWLPSSRYRLFSRIYLYDYTLEPFLRAVKASPFPIRNFIRYLDLHSGREDASLQAFLHELGPLPLVATLCLRMNHAILALNAAALARTFPTLPNLVLHDCRLPPAAVFDAALAFPGLRSLGLNWLDLEPDDGTNSYSLPYASRFPTQCRALTLSGRSTEPFLEAFLTLNTVPVFASLSTQGIFPTEDSLFGQYLRRVGNNLHHLRYTRASIALLPTALCYCTALKSLSVSFYSLPAGSPNVPSRILQMLPYLRSRALSALTFDMLPGAYSGAPIADDWDRLDRALSPSEFTRVQTLTFVSRAREVAELPRYMPLAAARGVLRVVLVKAR
ncbi:hypothetical protein C8R44DRAFT_845935 [Mycena epipterygia]|nr:hypothetical protein C8R44DRAFT_845935 [Mycena epipterygia]